MGADLRGAQEKFEEEQTRFRFLYTTKIGSIRGALELPGFVRDRAILIIRENEVHNNLPLRRDL